MVNNWPTTEATFTTEEVFQIPDGGFDKEWTKDVIDAVDYSFKLFTLKIGLVGQNIDKWYPYDKDDKENLFWSTSNTVTTDVPTDHGTAYYIQYSGVQRKNSSVEISTIGWGYGSTYSNWFNSWKAKKITPGELFAASYENGEIVEGHPISSRPSKMSFDYQYSPLDADKFIVSVSLEDINGNPINNDSRVEIGNTSGTYIFDFSSYMNDPAVNTKKAARIKIRFKSGTKTTVNHINGSVGETEGNSDSRFVGSVLTIDNVKLIYE